MIIFLGVIDDDREEYDRTAKDAENESTGHFIQPGFMVEAFIRSHQGIEDEPAEGDGDGSQPEAVGEPQLVMDKDRF